jgi:hypothetical protein
MACNRDIFTLLTLLLLVGWDWVSCHCDHYWPILSAPDDRWGCWWRNWWNEDWAVGNRSTRSKPDLSATLSATNLTWLDPGSKPGRRGGKPATNRLSYGAVSSIIILSNAPFPLCTVPSGRSSPLEAGKPAGTVSPSIRICERFHTNKQHPHKYYLHFRLDFSITSHSSLRQWAGRSLLPENPGITKKSETKEPLIFQSREFISFCHSPHFSVQ